MSKPLLSIGIIFKNEIRCLERCLKSLQRLREAVPCELVMADTGSDDGSRAVAEKYADLLVDFPWTGDFSAARNAVMGRCTGKWYLTIDSDEWLDEDFSELKDFLYGAISKKTTSCAVIQRNYSSLDIETGLYADFFAVRIYRMFPGIHYEGVVHETVPGSGNAHYLSRTILHHDGYVRDIRASVSKGERNMELLEKKLEQNPHDLITIQQCFESSGKLEYIRQALEGVIAKWPDWDCLGPAIYEHAVRAAHTSSLPEFWEWVQQAEETFPDSLTTRVEMQFTVVAHCMEEKNFEEAVRRAKACLAAIADYHAGRFHPDDLRYCAINGVSAYAENSMRLFLAASCFEEKDYLTALDMLRTIDGSVLDAKQTSHYLTNLLNIHIHSELDTHQDIVEFWGQISSEVPNKKRAEERQYIAFSLADKAFAPELREQEEQDDRILRSSYTLFLPLRGRCELGAAAAILQTESAEEMESELRTVKKWMVFSVYALSRALKAGVAFPPPGMSLMVEEMDHLSAQLAQQLPQELEDSALRAAAADLEDWQFLLWARGLMMTAVQKSGWTDEKAGMELARAYARVESVYLRRCYQPEVFCQEGIVALPPVHRFGWFCSQAFAALDRGDSVQYVHLLRDGVNSSPSMNKIAGFLTQHTPQLQAPPPSQELLELAEKVRLILSAYPADDPAVAALKSSPAYQMVAHLI